MGGKQNKESVQNKESAIDGKSKPTIDGTRKTLDDIQLNVQRLNELIQFAQDKPCLACTRQFEENAKDIRTCEAWIAALQDTDERAELIKRLKKYQETNVLPPNIRAPEQENEH
jgi:hypothetical protein